MMMIAGLKAPRFLDGMPSDFTYKKGCVMITRYLAAAVVTAGILSASFAGDTAQTEKPLTIGAEHNNYRYAIGAGAGMSGGNGISLQKWFTPVHGLQLNFFPYYNYENYSQEDSDEWDDRDSGYSKSGLFSAGLTYLCKIEEMRDLRIFTYGSASTLISYKNEKYYNVNYSDYTVSGGFVREVLSSTRVNDTEYSLSGSGGVGGGFTVWRFTGTMLIGIVGTYNFTDKAARITPSIDVSAHFLLGKRTL